MKVQDEKAKNQGENLVQRGECKMCFYGHKNLFSLFRLRWKTFPNS